MPLFPDSQQAADAHSARAEGIPQASTEMLINRARILARTGRVKRAFSESKIPTIVIGERQEVNV
jgi:hypothetical protein